MHRRHLASSILPALALLVACDVAPDPEPPPRADAFRALTTAQGEYFDVVTWPREAIGPAMRATGHLIVRLDGPAGTGPASPPTTTDISGTCGVTFVSSRIAVTAGHCLPGLTELDEVEVRTPRVLPSFVPTPGITGIFPSYVHSHAPGHDYDRYLCEVRSRCYMGSGAGPQINCNIDPGDVSISFSEPQLDIGILDCDALDGARHDYIDVAPTIAQGDDLAMAWYHELYTPPVAEPSASDFQQHYVTKLNAVGPGDITPYLQNYHYRGAGERHQMLPLLSTDYYGSRWKVLHPPTGPIVPTNLRGCHGTSGSGVLRKDSAFYPELVGPVTTAPGSIAGKLCHVAGADADTTTTINAMHPEITRHFVDQYIPPSCSNPDSFPSRLAYWLSCDILSLDELVHERWQFRPPICPWCLAFARLDPATMEAMRFSASEPASLALRPNELGLPYRASVRVWTNDFPTTVELRVGTTTIATHTFTGQDEQWLGNYASSVLSAGFVADTSTEGPVTIAVAQGSAAPEISVSQVLLVQDGQTDAFDTMHQRMSYGVLDGQDLGADADPMVFTASPDGGFAATLEPSQRMVATGLALTAGSAWQVVLTGDAAELRCGLVFADGSETSGDCQTNGPAVILDGTTGGPPVALFVETDGNAPPLVSLYDLVVREVPSCAPPHDRCETGGVLDAACDACVDAICLVDPYCCNSAWDGICVGEVLDVCGQVQCDASKGACVHSVCATGPALVDGCDPPVSPSCVSAICGADPYCCNNAWDGVCVGEVASVCNLQCG